MRLKHVRFLVMLVFAFLILGWQRHATAAYDTDVNNTLLRSKNALLTQRTELLAAADKKKDQITQLQLDVDRLQAYIRDTDRTLRDIDIALGRNN